MSENMKRAEARGTFQSGHLGLIDCGCYAPPLITSPVLRSIFLLSLIHVGCGTRLQESSAASHGKTMLISKQRFSCSIDDAKL